MHARVIIDVKVAARTPVALPGTALFSLSQLSVAGIGNGRVHSRRSCDAKDFTVRADTARHEVA